MKSKYVIQAACGSNIGKIRRKNEDNYCFNGNLFETKNNNGELLMYRETIQNGLSFALFDGMGGENFGEVASEIAAKKYLKNEKLMSGTSSIKAVVNELNNEVVLKQQELLTERMGTTFASIHFFQNNIYVCNVGDSRVYRYRKGSLLQFSVDHIDRHYSGHGSKGNLTQYLGLNPDEVLLEPHILKRNFELGDIYILCTDGLTDMVPDYIISNILLNNVTATRIVEELISSALENGGRDNVTIIACIIE